MTHVLVYVEESAMCRMVAEMCELEGYTVTTTHTPDDALMVLRTSLHRIVAIMEWNHIWLHLKCDFFALRDAHPDWYARHGYLGIRWWPMTDEERAALAAAGVRILPSPFLAEDLLRALEELAAERV